MELNIKKYKMNVIRESKQSEKCEQIKCMQKDKRDLDKYNGQNKERSN